MGIVYRGIHEPIALEMRNKYGLDSFLETGTFHAETTKWALGYFHEVITIEASKELYDQHAPELKQLGAVPLWGESQYVLSTISDALDKQPMLIWLDAHYSGANTFTGDNPILKEIQIINQSSMDHVIMVDDYRIFNPGEVAAIVLLLQKGGKRKVTIKDDIFLAEPL